MPVFAGYGRRLRRGLQVLGAVALGCAAWGGWMPGTAQSPPKIKELDLPAPTKRSGGAGAAPAQGCEAALAEGYGRFEDIRNVWVEAANAGRLLPALGRAARVAEEAALSSFDSNVEKQGLTGSCKAQRAALQTAMRKEVRAVFLVQRQLTERSVRESLSNQLLDLMEKRGGPLRVQEKIDLLVDAVKSYKKKVSLLLPAWDTAGDPEEAAVEKRLGDLELTIEDSQDGQALQLQWDKSETQRLLSRRAQGFSVSFDPALRVMVRPEGLGNLQVFSVGPVGPPDKPAVVNIGILNDGSIADVYREMPVPPLFAVQPAVKVNFNVGL